MISVAMTESETPYSSGEKLRAPFPWFGGKSRVAEMVWARFGNVANYSEPFAGSLAVLLGRPHMPRVETVNDLDCYLSNFWRALQHDPDGVARYADYPVNEADLHARHRWLVQGARAQAERVMTDPEFYDVKIAGFWVYGQCLWIGSGWCEHPEWSGRANAGRRARGINTPQFDRNGLGTVHQKRRPQLTGDQGIVIQRTAATRSGENPSEQRRKPHTDRGGKGVHRKIFDATSSEKGPSRKRFVGPGNGQGTGVHRRWQGGGKGGGSGVHAPGLTRQKPQLSGDGSGNSRGLISESVGLYDYLRLLSDRLRRVRVCCGDWARVLTPSVTSYIGTTGVFLDPPYSHELRERCYAEDHDVSVAVRMWALEHGDDPQFRIALCGYEGEHQMPATWECVPWKAHGGYSRSERGKANRERERIWFSPHCLQHGLFGLQS